jgi:hypothetical protein
MLICSQLITVNYDFVLVERRYSQLIGTENVSGAYENLVTGNIFDSNFQRTDGNSYKNKLVNEFVVRTEILSGMQSQPYTPESQPIKSTYPIDKYFYNSLGTN